MKLNNFLLVLAVTAGIMLAAHWTGLWVSMGAHPWWSGTTTWFGIAGGVVVTSLAYFILPKSLKSTMLQAGVFLLLAVIAFAVSRYGKAGFVGSYAEDASAGRLWYLGFIGFTFSTYCTLAALARFGRWSRKNFEG